MAGQRQRLQRQQQLTRHPLEQPPHSNTNGQAGRLTSSASGRKKPKASRFAFLKTGMRLAPMNNTKAAGAGR